MSDRKNTLRDEDIRDTDAMSRRRFVQLALHGAGVAAGSVAVAACVPGGAGGFYPPGSGSATVSGSDDYEDDYWTETVSSPSGNYTGLTDADGEPYADPAGYGRGSNPYGVGGPRYSSWSDYDSFDNYLNAQGTGWCDQDSYDEYYYGTPGRQYSWFCG